MSNPPPPIPPDQPQVWDYFTPPEDKARKLVRLAVIFNYISVGLDALLVVVGIGAGMLFALDPEFEPRNPSDPPPAVLAAIYIGIGTMAAMFGVVKVIATRKLQRAGPGAWGWGLTAGIVGCVQLLCASCCCLQVAAGIYTIIILNMQNVRHYLDAQAAGDAPDAPPPATP